MPNPAATQHTHLSEEAPYPGIVPGCTAPSHPVLSELMLLLCWNRARGKRAPPLPRGRLFAWEGRWHEAVYSGPGSAALHASSSLGRQRAQPAHGAGCSPCHKGSLQLPLCPSCPHPLPPLLMLGTPFPVWHTAGPRTGMLPPDTAPHSAP